MVTETQHTEEEVWEILDTIKDPEIPVLTLCDLGIIRNVEINNSKCIVTITPTYSGCPAMDLIEAQIMMILEEKDFDNVEIKTKLSPAWTTDWITEEGKKKLKEYGIAPPEKSVGKGGLMLGETSVKCPQCDSEDTKLVSSFGSTACKAMYRCNACNEPFEYFKCH